MVPYGPDAFRKPASEQMNILKITGQLQNFEISQLFCSGKRMK
jgi:hypothetical protein